MDKITKWFPVKKEIKKSESIKDVNQNVEGKHDFALKKKRTLDNTTDHPTKRSKLMKPTIQTSLQRTKPVDNTSKYFHKGSINIKTINHKNRLRTATPQSNRKTTNNNSSTRKKRLSLPKSFCTSSVTCNGAKRKSFIPNNSTTVSESVKTASSATLKKTHFFDKNESVPPNHGKRELPYGKPNCLAGFRFVLTGLLFSLTREEATDLIQQYGGRVTTSVSGMTAFLVAGAEPGESKMDKAKAKNIKIINEEGLFDLIETRPAGKSLKKSRKVKEKSVLVKSDCVNSFALWVDKYKPRKLSDLIGNKSNIEKMVNFLKRWPKVEHNSCLISGPPGIGKSSSAAIIARESGWRVLELNASMARSKKNLKERVSALLGNHCIQEYQKRSLNSSGRTLLIMDEVDGMSAGDRGGTAELVKMIKVSKIPIFCICNDRSNPKIRSLVQVCIDLKFRKPTVQQCWPRLSEICRIEGITIDQQTLGKMIQSGGADIRQIINNLQLWTKDGSRDFSYVDVKKKLDGAAKDLTTTPWETIPKMFYPPQNSTIRDHIDMYFVDRSLLPLMVEHNYLKVRSCGLKELADASEALADADIMSSHMMQNQDWSILPKHALISCARPINKLLPARVGGVRFDFPIFFGKLSKANRLKRELSNTHHHVSNAHSGSTAAYRMEFIPVAVRKINSFLVKGDEKSLDQVINFMKYYNLNKDDLEIMMELEGKFQMFGKVSTAVTKCFNKLCQERLQDHTKPEDFKVTRLKQKKVKSKVKRSKNGVTKKKRNVTKKKGKGKTIQKTLFGFK